MGALGPRNVLFPDLGAVSVLITYDLGPVLYVSSIKFFFN